MRPLEITLVLLLAAFFVAPLLPGLRSRRLWVLPLLAAGVTILHLALEGYRWQMLPLYLLAGACMLLSAFRLARGGGTEQPSAWRRWAGALLGIGLIGLAAALPALFPIPRLPAPSGPYPVGVQTLTLSDPSRPEIYGPQPGGARRLMVKIWYPAAAEPAGEPGPWIEDSAVVGEAVAGWLGLPAFTLDHLQYARTHAYPQAELNRQAAPYPLLLFSHGWGGFRAQNTYQMEELASHGYVVAAVEHTYGAVVTVFPDGSTAHHDPATLPGSSTTAAFEQAANRLIQQWRGDLEFVLDTLQAQNASPEAGPFSGALDLQRVGLLGHSTGGGAAIEFCSQDARCGALLAMDAYLLPVSPAVFEQGLQQPSLFIFSEYWPSPENKSRFQQLFRQSRGPALDLTLLGGDHYDFTDLPLLSPLAPNLGLKGPVDGSRALEAVRGLSVQFFNRYLLGQPAPQLNDPQAGYPEIRLDGQR